MSLSPSKASTNVKQASSPSTSPNRVRTLISEGVIDEENPAYQSAMSKIYEASWKFDRGKNGELLKTLDSRELLPEQFRQILKAGMNCRLTNEEFAAIFPIFNNNGFFDGCEFILLFYRLRYEHRGKLLTKRVQIDKRHRELLKLSHQKHLEDLLNKKHINLVDDFSSEDEQSAIAKVLNAAVKYDRLMPGAAPLDGFDIERLTAGEFREQMKLVFNVTLSVKEISAYIRYFNKDKDDPTDETINCAAFLVVFFRMGFQEKTRRLHEVWAEKKIVQEEKEKKRIEAEAELERKNAMKVSFNFTEEDKERAIVKLRTAARLYDKTTPGAMSMKSFEVKEMPPHIFKEQLKRIFNLNVTPAEMGALMSVFDCNGDGVITCEEFTKVFINMGFEEREKELKAAIQKQKRYEQMKKEEEEKKELEKTEKSLMKVSYEYTEEERISAMNKLIEAAWRYDKNTPGAQSLDAFESQHMEPLVFKEQLRNAFYMKLTPQELGAIINYFDPEKSGKIHCPTFLKRFFREGYEERQRRKVQWRDLQKELNKKREVKEKIKLQELDMKTSLVSSSVNRDFTEQDFQSAFAKLTMGALKYDAALPGAMKLTAFEVIAMPPHVFREQLKLTFNIKVSVNELWALMSYFDKENTGEINCKQFVHQFLRTGFEERDRIKQSWKDEQKMKKEVSEKLIQDKQQEAINKAWSEVDFEFNEVEFDQALYRFVMMCHFVDQRTIGPGGLQAFEASLLNPAEFREMLKRTFNFRVNARELGALVMFFDTQLKKMVHCTTFLNTLTQIRARCEDFKGKADEEQNLLEYEKQLKAQYLQRVARNPSVDAKPWRQVSGLTALSGNRKVFKNAKAGPPTNPTEKYRLRLAIGRRTGRMDLACKEIWLHSPLTAQAPSRPALNPSTTTEPVPTTEAPPTTENIPLDEITNDLNNLQVAEESSSVSFFVTAESQEEGILLPTTTTTAAAAEEELNETSILDALMDSDSIIAAESEALRDDEEEGGEGVDETKDDIDLLFAEVIQPDSDDQSTKSHKQQQQDEENNMDMPPLPINGNLPIPAIEFRLNAVPKEVLALAELRELWLCNHSITTIPPKINTLKCLQTLSFKNNLLESLPPQICDLPNLKRLFLKGNKLTSLPNVFNRLTELVELNLAKNQFAEFPEVIASMSHIVILDMSNNPLITLPPSMIQMKGLNELNVEENAWTEPPMVLGKMPWVEVRGCAVLPRAERVCKSFIISPDEEYELTSLLKRRATVRLQAKQQQQQQRSVSRRKKITASSY